MLLRKYRKNYARKQFFKNLPIVNVMISTMAKLNRKKFGGALMYEFNRMMKQVKRFPGTPAKNKMA